MMKSNLRKRILAGIGTLALAAGILSGCGNTGASSTTAGGSGDFKVAYISACPFEDGGWGSSCYAGYKASAEKFEGITTYEAENVSLENLTSTVKKYCDSGVDLIISPDADLSDPVAEVAEDYPNIRFAVIDGTYTAENAMTMSQDNAQIGYIAGVIAALQTKTNSIGFVGGEETDEIVKASKAMEAGAKSINPDIAFTSVMSGSWTDVAKGKEIGLSMISSNNVDVIFSFASGVDSGVREACVSSKDVYFIAQPSEAMEEAPEITVTSIIQSNEKLIYNAMEAVKEDNFKGEFTKYGFGEEGTCSLGKFNSFFDGEKQKQVQETVESIVKGDIDVYSCCN